MNYGFDLEGTLDADVEMFSDLCAALVAEGRRVYVITAYWSESGGYDEGQERLRWSQLDAIGFEKDVHYTELICTPGSTVEQQGENKRAMCEQRAVRLMFEDRQVFTDEISKVSRCVLMQPRA